MFPGGAWGADFVGVCLGGHLGSDWSLFEAEAIGGSLLHRDILEVYWEYGNEWGGKEGGDGEDGAVRCVETKRPEGKMRNEKPKYPDGPSRKEEGRKEGAGLITRASEHVSDRGHCASGESEVLEKRRPRDLGKELACSLGGVDGLLDGRRGGVWRPVPADRRHWPLEDIGHRPDSSVRNLNGDRDAHAARRGTLASSVPRPIALARGAVAGKCETGLLRLRKRDMDRGFNFCLTLANSDGPPPPARKNKLCPSGSRPPAFV